MKIDSETINVWKGMCRWKKAFIKYHLKQKEIYYSNGKYYYKDQLLQEKANGNYYYKTMYYEVDIYDDNRLEGEK
jgi:hypothetical protein